MVRSKKTNKRKKIQRGGVLKLTEDETKDLRFKLITSNNEFENTYENADVFIDLLKNSEIHFPSYWVNSEIITSDDKESEYIQKYNHHSIFKLYEIWLKSGELFYGILSDILKKQAVAAGVSQAEIDLADNSDDPFSHMTELIQTAQNRDKEEAEKMKKQMINDLIDEHELPADLRASDSYSTDSTLRQTWEAIMAKSEAAKALEEAREEARGRLSHGIYPPTTPYGIQGGKKSKKRSKRKKSKKSRKARKSRKSRRK